MNQPVPTQIPNAPAATAPAASPANVSTPHVELEGACVDLLCKLEFLVCAMKEADPADRNEVAVESAQQMLSEMADFSAAFFTGAPAAKADDEIAQAFLASTTLAELTKSHSLGGFLRRTFGGDDPNAAEIAATSDTLIKSLKRCIVTLIFHAIQLVGFDSQLGQQLDQGTLLFVSELESI